MSDALSRLTPRQREVLSYKARGYSNVEIGRVLGTSPETVRTQCTSITSRMQANMNKCCAIWACWETERLMRQAGLSNSEAGEKA